MSKTENTPTGPQGSGCSGSPCSGSETLHTDALAFHVDELDYDVVSADYARRLHRENNRLKACLIFIRDECDWETPRGDFGGGGDERIGPAITRVLSQNARDEGRDPSEPQTTK